MTKGKVFFSIIIPVYNVEKYVKRCVNSILNQNFNDFEIIIVDDGSTDNSAVICDEISKEDDRVLVIHKKNEGLGYARNTGLDVANGQYVFFIDSDDYVLPNLLKDTYNTILIRQRPDIIFYGFERINNKGRVVYRSIPNPSKKVYIGEEIKESLLPDFIFSKEKERNLTISAWCCCINLKFLQTNSLRFVSEREYISEDVYFFMDMFYYLKNVDFICFPYYCYCQNESSLTTSYRKDRFERQKEFYSEMLKISDRYKYKKEIKNRLYGLFLANVMACLKMEVGNRNNTTRKQAFMRAKKIYKDDFLNEAITNYNVKHRGIGWKFFYFCIKNKKYYLLSNVLLIKYKLKGI